MEGGNNNANGMFHFGIDAVGFRFAVAFRSKCEQ
jgi:hypothetical protein